MGVTHNLLRTGTKIKATARKTENSSQYAETQNF